MTDIIIVNQSTGLTDAQIQAVVPAAQAQVTEDWLPHWPGRSATLHFGTGPDGAWTIDIMDTSDVPGALGYHDEMNGLPYGRVFARDAIRYGESWTVDLTHELLEMLGDPDVNTILPLPHNLHCYQEVCDAVEADKYGYHKPEWPNVLLTDFCLQSYFTGSPGPFDFRQHLKKPAPGLLSGGYLGIELPNGSWTQIVKRQEDGSFSRRARRIGRTVRRLR